MGVYIEEKDILGQGALVHHLSSGLLFESKTIGILLIVLDGRIYNISQTQKYVFCKWKWGYAMHDVLWI